MSIKRVVLSTDDEEIAKISESIGAEIPFIRPHDLANDKASSFGLVEHTVEFPGGTYYYVITNEFPGVPRCFVGTPSNDFKIGPG